MKLSEYAARIQWTIEANEKKELGDGKSICQFCDHENTKHTHKDCDDCLFNPKYTTAESKEELKAEIANIKAYEAMGLLDAD